MRKIKKGDDVIIITGKDKGKRGTVLRMVSADLVVIEECRPLSKTKAWRVVKLMEKESQIS